MEEKKSYFKWGEFLSYYKPFRGIFAADMFFAFLGALTTLVIPLIVRYIGSLTLCLPLDFHNPLHYSPLRLIFLSNFCFFSVLFCTLVV